MSAQKENSDSCLIYSSFLRPYMKKLTQRERILADVDDEICALKKKIQAKYKLRWTEARDAVNSSIVQLYRIKLSAEKYRHIMAIYQQMVLLVKKHGEQSETKGRKKGFWDD